MIRGILVALVLLLAIAPIRASSAPPVLVNGEPHPTLRHALMHAIDGDVILVQGGTHAGPLRIDASLTLRATRPSMIQGAGIGDVVTIRAPNVTFEGFEVRGSGDRHDTGDSAVSVEADNVTIRGNKIRESLFGIWVEKAANATIVENDIIGDADHAEARRGDGIRLWYSPNALVAGNRLDGTRDLVVWYARNVRLENNSIANARYGLHLMFAGDSVARDNTITDSSVGIYAMSSRGVEISGNHIQGSRGTSGYAVAFKDADDVDVHDNLLVDNSVGVYLDTTPFTPEGSGRFTRNILVANDAGIMLLPAVSRNEFRDNTFWENQEAVRIHGGHASGGNEWIGNYWSGFVGYDRDGDGISEAPYVADRLFESLADREPRLRVLAYSPLVDAIDAAGNAFPIARPEPKLQDAAPRTTPHPLPGPPPAPLRAAPDAAPVVFLGSVVLAIVALRAIPVSSRREPMRPDAPLLRVGSLSAGYGRSRILDQVQLELRAGQAVALWGENGAGKTTLIKAILGLVPKTGTVHLGGIDADIDPRAARALVGYVPQDVILDDARVYDVVRQYAALRRAPMTRGDELLAELGLNAHRTKRTSELSGGLRQRLALVLALLNDPPVLLLDEPTANLDAAAREDHLRQLVRLRDEGKAILFTSHRLDEVAALADRVLHIRREKASHEASTEGFLAENRPLVMLRRLPP